ncbi:hypothetical protein [Paenibacillus periandrae]|uniref:hypothetical protein n=1 Tax=Paenibacillus periandrae TaxID=1761741 RepID=UPI001F096EAB|nr:hypothetical protein [Paenibacillus periandrae]
MNSALIIFSSFTLAYEIVLLLRLPTFVLFCMLPFFIWFFFKHVKKTSYVTLPKLLSMRFLLILFSVSNGLLCLLLYSFNPDDPTFFNKTAVNVVNLQAQFSSNDIRLAYDDLPAMSAAHLLSSWEYFMQLVGYYSTGSMLQGYHNIGAFTCGFFVPMLYFAFYRNFKLKETTSMILVAFTLTYLLFDAQVLRSVGSWYFISGWVGKCLLAAYLPLLFSLALHSIKSEKKEDWILYLLCVISFGGLSGSSLFIIPSSIGLIALSYLIKKVLVLRSKIDFGVFRKSLIIFVPSIYIVMLGGLSIIVFGNLKDASYWESTNLNLYNFIFVVFSPSHLLFLTLFPIFVVLVRERKTLFYFQMLATYQILALIVFVNPIFAKLWVEIIPKDAYWRIYYIIPYPAIVALTLYIMFLRLKKVTNKISKFGIITLATCLILSHFVTGKTVFSMQKEISFAKNFKNPWDYKLEIIPTEFINGLIHYRNFLNENQLVFLAPEEIEIVFQQLYPFSTTISARHMEQVFNNAQKPLAIDVLTRRFSERFVSGARETEYEEAFNLVVKKFDIDVIVFRKNEGNLIKTNQMIKDNNKWTIIGANEHYLAIANKEKLSIYQR